MSMVGRVLVLALAVLVLQVGWGVYPGQVGFWRFWSIWMLGFYLILVATQKD